MPGIRWDVLTIGHLSRNKFWGEPDGAARRPPLCTSTLIRCEGGPTIVVDPGLAPDDMHAVLASRAGLRPADVDIVLLTHFHADHRVGVDAFPRARRLMADGELASVREGLERDDPARQVVERLAPADAVLGPGVEMMATPGHTPGHHSLTLRAGDATVVVAGDAVMTRDFFFARDCYFNTVDRAEAVRSIDRIARVADVVVPGHDNCFLARPVRGPAKKEDSSVRGGEDE